MNYEILESFFNGECCDAHKLFGAQKEKDGYRITLWAPNAKTVTIKTNEQSIMMDKVDDRGIYSSFIPYLKEEDTYVYEVTQIHSINKYKIDPFSYGVKQEGIYKTFITDRDFNWDDSLWMKQRDLCIEKPMNVYELYFGAWRQGETYATMASTLIPYLKEHNFTHVELMPISEYPFDGSWGYQVSGFYAPTSRYGKAKDLKAFINACHKEGIGVFLDFVCVHFASDDFSLHKFDGTSMYEYSSERDAYSEWGSANFDVGKKEVRSFLMSAASYWLEEFHIDGLRMDAISNIVYFQGNRDRGVNTKGLSFIKKMNTKLKEKYPTVILMAEDSTAFPDITKPVNEGGLGFDYKWDMGWMHDTLSYFKKEVKERKNSHHELTFSMYYFYNERYLLELSHDEVVHGKKTILDKMPGSYEEKFAQTKLLYMYMYTHPGKKLNFMGNELGMFREFDVYRECDWNLLDYPMHQKFNSYMKDLMHLYKESTLHTKEYDRDGFKWIEVDNKEESIYTYLRNENYLIVLNMSNNEYKEHKISIDKKGLYVEVINSDSLKYGGNSVEGKQYYTKEDNLFIHLAPYSGIILEYKEV